MLAPVARVIELHKRRDALVVEVSCPHECGETHRHGVGSLLDLSAITARVGHRVGECANDPDVRMTGYVLADVDDVIPRALDAFSSTAAQRRRSRSSLRVVRRSAK